MTTQETLLAQKLDHVREIRARLDEQRKLLAHYEQHPSAQILAADMRQSVRISIHHLEDAVLDIENFKGGNVCN
jgi:hypothetical protein